jgi:hypothetical protein
MSLGGEWSVVSNGHPAYNHSQITINLALAHTSPKFFYAENEQQLYQNRTLSPPYNLLKHCFSMLAAIGISFL